jgi:hypothetical protein
MKRLTRRDVARAAVGAMAAAAAQAPAQDQKPAPPNHYIGPLTGVNHGTEDRHLDPVAYCRSRYEAAPCSSRKIGSD